MCGIAGLVGAPVAGLADRMNAVQSHRGPDGRGVFEEPGVALAHRRLSILDLSDAAAQPMKSPDGRFVLAYNGEIYNFAELRDGLRARGETFRSTGDTEVLLLGLARHGADFVKRLNGMFAFALWDRFEQELLLARDPLGVKPLYLAEPAPGELVFASEIKAVLAHPAVPRAPDFDALLQHLAFGHACGDRTALRGVRRLPPGHLLRWRKGRPTLERYWTPPFGSAQGTTRSEAVDRLRDALRRATRRQLVSDVPVGAFFSGGLDSTLLTALTLGEGAPKGFTAFTITYPSAENVLDRAEEDAPFARRAADALGIRQVEREIKPDVTDLLPRLVWHLDEPLVDPAVIACFLVSRVARESGTPVLLSGQGGDELFAGYPRYRAMAASAWLDRAPSPVRRAAAGLGRLLPGARAGRLGATARRLRRALSSVDEAPDRRFLAYCAGTPDEAIAGVLSPDVLAELGGRRPSDDCLLRMDSERLTGVDRWLERDLSVYLPNHNLLYTDKMGMAVGLEARVPLLDLELVEAVARYPAEWKISGGTTKAILRDAARGTVPDEVIDRPKAGFGAPYRKWLRHDLEALWGDLTADAVVRRRGWFDPAGLRKARELSQSGRQDLYMLQWAVLTIEVWARQFIDRSPLEGCSIAPGHPEPAVG
ncbi:MAG TPA: asparagine synthase (glutamine-hydrolyzing) [Planctomycetota bacterium]|nr:asparagine synthase (glutamine-hydrolyzing) [Planctomycetota bacterium]